MLGSGGIGSPNGTEPPKKMIRYRGVSNPDDAEPLSFSF